MNKTVYILGAGFSIEAGAPSQERLVEKMFQVHEENPYVFPHDKMSEFKRFLTETLRIPPEIHSQVPLEDIFTPLDRCLLDNISFRNLTLDEIRRKRDLIYFLIGRTLQYLLQGPEKQYVNDFAYELVYKSAQRRGNYRNFDPVSVISTNWDILLDTSIKTEIDKSYKGQGVVDYCCYISSFDQHDESIKPGLEMLGMGGFNVKLLKVHGSLNWLQCPRCLRLYVDFSNKIAIEQYNYHQNCRHCDKHFGELPSHELTSNLIMPTFLKNLSNPQYKLIWQNAGVELSEASKIIFIGYSLPQADYEMRQLLSRMVKNEAEIEVVDYGDEGEIRIRETKKRYEIFFGNRKISFFLKGAKAYINEKMGRG